MSNLRNDPDGHLELGCRFEMARCRGELPSLDGAAPTDGERRWADFMEALLDDAEKWNDSEQERSIRQAFDESGGVEP